MKKQISFCTMLFFLFLGTAAIAGNTSGNLINPITPTGIIAVVDQAPTVEEEAIYCKITMPGTGVTVECWLCNCGKLYDSIFPPTPPAPQP